MFLSIITKKIIIDTKLLFCKSVIQLLEFEDITSLLFYVNSNPPTTDLKTLGNKTTDHN